MTAWFMGLGLWALLVGVQTLDAGLSTLEQDARFNDSESDLNVMITTYDVGAVELNLHQACDSMIVSVTF